MGNLISYSSKTSTNPYLVPDQCFLFLTKCIFHIGSKQDLTKLFRQYIRLHSGKSFFIVKSELKRMTAQTRLENYEDLIFTYFTLKSLTKINVMEVFAGLIAYSDIHWTEKVKFAFKLYDFDRNKVISEDELFIMCKCFVDAVALLTNGAACSNLMIKELVDSNNQKTLTLQQYFLGRFMDWVESKQSISLFINPMRQTGTLSALASTPVPKIGSGFNKSFDKSALQANPKGKRRTQSSLGYNKEEKIMIVVGGVPVTKALLVRLKRSFENAGKNGKSFGYLLIEELRKLNFKEFGRVSERFVYTNFRNFLSDLFTKAGSDQINRMLGLLGLLAPLSDNQSRPKKNTKRIAIEQLFKKFDSNGDGVIELEELKIALEPNFTDLTIEGLFKEHSKNKLGLEISDFTEMFEGNK